MIYKLRKKFIVICMLSFLIAFLLIFAAIFVICTIQTNQTLDGMADMIYENGGRFPQHPPNGNSDFRFPMNNETPFATRFFILSVDAEEIVSVKEMSYISSIDEQTALEYGRIVLENGSNGGWKDDYRYKTYEKNGEKTILFINGAMFNSQTKMLLLSASAVLVSGGIILFVLVIIVSKRVVNPVAESYERQKQFVTNANHELKTPLTLILTNIDIAESELGRNEWLDDIRSEGENMALLVSKLVTLARMDEDSYKPKMTEFSLSLIVSEVAAEFEPLAKRKGFDFKSEIAPGIRVKGDENEIKQTLVILLENALKYCDKNGEIRIILEDNGRAILKVENTCINVGNIKLNCLFDRFYREDKARTSGSGFGVGLSIAKSIVEKHKGEISVCAAGDNVIRFKLKLKSLPTKNL